MELDGSSHDAIVAAVSNPKYKLRWINDVTLKENAKSFFLQEIQKFQEPDRIEQAYDSQVDDFLVFAQTPNNFDEASAFLDSSNSSFEMLEAFPLVKKVFKKFNTPLNSSGAIERSFTFAGILDDAKRGSIKPTNFETCMFLKGNQVYAKHEE